MKRWLIILATLIPGAESEAQEKFLRKISPQHGKVQFAGGIGFISAGVGYGNPKRNLEADVFYGYVPKQFGGIAMHSLTGKLSYHPFRPGKVLNLQVQPFTVGLQGTYTFGKQYFLYSPDNYPYNYYGFPTALHAGFFVGGNVSTTFNKKTLRGVGIYYELGTNDVELKSYLANSSIPLRDIVNLAIGIKTNF